MGVATEEEGCVRRTALLLITGKEQETGGIVAFSLPRRENSIL
jgi:hypothetical protein